MTFDRLDIADPWIALTAIALATERVRLGAMVTPLARRRPWDVARQVAVLDRLSGGRMVFGAGLGGDSRRELTAFGEERDPRASRGAARRGPRRDRSICGPAETASAATAPAFVLDEAQVRPTPLQQPQPAGVAGLRRGPTAARSCARRATTACFPVSHEASVTRRRRARHPRDRRACIAPPAPVPFDLVVVNHERPDADRLSRARGCGRHLVAAGLRRAPAAVRRAGRRGGRPATMMR